jgi:hypothetical protein
MLYNITHIHRYAEMPKKKSGATSSTSSKPPAKRKRQEEKEGVEKKKPRVSEGEFIKRIDGKFSVLDFRLNDRRENPYTYTFEFVQDKGKNELTFRQADQAYRYPIPNNDDTMAIYKVGLSKHFPPMRSGENSLYSYSNIQNYKEQIAKGISEDAIELEPKKDKFTVYSLMDMMDAATTFDKNKKIIREEMNETVNHEDDGIVYSGNTVKWYSPSLYGAFLIYMYEHELIEKYVIKRLGPAWATGKTTALIVMVTSIMADVVAECEKVFSKKKKSENTDLIVKADAIMKRGFSVVNNLLMVLIGPEASPSVKTKLKHVDSAAIHTVVTQVLRYTPGHIKDKKPNTFFLEYTRLTIDSDHEKEVTIVDDEQTQAEWVYIKYIKPVMKSVLDENAYQKSVRASTKAKRQEMLNLTPKRISEARVWDVANEFIQTVFPPGYEGAWDAEYNGVKNANTLAAALCLIQMCIGSRSRGVVAVNIFSMYDKSNSKPGDGDEAIRLFNDKQHLVTVDRITKEKLKSIELAARLTNTFNDGDKDKLTKALAAMEDGDDMTDAKKTMHKSTEDVQHRQEDDALQRRITKPLQYYFFDPMSYSYIAEKKEDRLLKWSDPDPITHDPRRVFCRLVEYVRKTIKDEWEKKSKKSTLKWSEHDMGFGIKHIAVSRESEADNKGELNQLAGTYNRIMNIAVKNAFKKTKYLPDDQLNRIGTHELRRLYVCYSYQMFGAETMKEVAYARAVLNHESFEATLFYTSIQVVMAVGSKRTDVSKLSEDVVLQLGEMKKNSEDREKAYVVLTEKQTALIKNMQTQITNLTGKEAPLLRYMKITDTKYVEHDVLAFSRKVRGSSVTDRIDEGKRKVDELLALDIRPSWAMLLLLGMDKHYIKQIMAYYTEKR